MFCKFCIFLVVLLFVLWKDEYFLGVMNDFRDLFMNSLLSLSNVIFDFVFVMWWKIMGIYFVYINYKIVLGNVFILFIEMGCICIKKKNNNEL